MDRRWTAGVALAAGLPLLVAGCGTRLPDSAFRSTGPTVRPPVRSQSASQPASDVGVTATTVTVGIINSRTNAFDPRAFVGMYNGALAYFRTLDAHGGVHGRQVKVEFCDDQGQGPVNVTCVQTLIGSDHVFAFAANAVLSYDGASDVQKAGVPDIAGQPVDTAYDTYHDLYSLYGSQYPRSNTVPGFGGEDYNGTEVYRYFKEAFHTHVAAVVFYNQAVSQRFAEATLKGLRAEGYRAYPEEVNFALPDFNSAVLDMKQKHVDSVYDTLDQAGNVSLCRAIDANRLRLTAKVTTTQSWVDSVGSDYRDSPHCRNSLFAYGNTRNYEDTSDPQVAAFRAAVHAQHLDGRDQLSEWELEGWVAAQWLTDAMASCGAQLTRACVFRYMAGLRAYSGHGLLDPTGRNFIPYPRPPNTVHNCIGIARWQDSAEGGRGGWVTQPTVGDDTEPGGFSCFQVPWIPYPAS